MHDIPMDELHTLSAEHLDRYYRIITEGNSIRRHNELLSWLQGELQHFLPHDILIAVWGDFKASKISYDIVSALPGVRTEYSSPDTLLPLLHRWFNHWVELGKIPYTVGVGDKGFLLNRGELECPLDEALQSMKSALVHGLTNERSNHDCLYILFSAGRKLHESIGEMHVLLPYLDTTFCRITPLVRSQASTLSQAVQFNENDENAYWNLSKREIEIMSWVKMGKTNIEIASILDISVFTVKNHLRHVFKTLKVANRMQAATKVMQSLDQRG